MNWYYASGGQQMGPVDDAGLDDLVRRGVVRDDTLIWREGMAGWEPHAKVRGPRPALGVPPPPAASLPPPPQGGFDLRYCTSCGRQFPANQLTQVGSALICASCYPAYAQQVAAGITPAPVAMNPVMYGPRYAGFWIRFLARFIDWIVLGIVGLIIRIPLGLLIGGSAMTMGASGDPAAALAALPMILAASGIAIVLNIVIGVIYEAYFLSTRGATLGKMALGLKVIRADGAPVTSSLAVGRYFAMWLSGMILMIGYIIAGFDDQKRALHDHICSTRVIYAK